MKKEVFYITVDGTNYPISTDLPTGPDSGIYEVWQYGELLFSFNPKLNKCNEPSAALTKDYIDKNIDNELVQKIKVKIEQYYTQINTAD